MPACPACKSENPPDAQFCSRCGAPLGTLSAPVPRPVPAAPVPPALPSAPYPPMYPPRPLKDRSIALILEILPGLFGIFGMGWIYAGNVSTGIIWLVGVFCWDVAAGIVNVLTGGFGCLCTLPVGIVLIAVSATSLNSYTKEHPELFGP